MPVYKMPNSRNYVCERCVEDPDLQEVVRNNLISDGCDYCGRSCSIPIASELCEVTQRIQFVVDQYFTDPSNFVFWDGAEGGWQGHPVHDSWDLFAALGWEVSNQNLMEDIVSAFSDQEFADEDYWPGPYHKRQFKTWTRFKEIVKHQRRYTFWNMQEDVSLDLADPLPKDILKLIFEAIVETGLVKTLAPGTTFWRGRAHNVSRRLKAAREFSSPPISKATCENRMSPAGVPMFYASDDFDTSLLETVDTNLLSEQQFTAVQFEALESLRIVDLTNIPRFGFFSDKTRDFRNAVGFLSQFSKDISKPICKDKSQHLEYVPTQVFTEFIRFGLNVDNGSPMDGIRFRSSRTGKGCYALFLEQSNCLRNGNLPQRVKLKQGSHISVLLS